MTITLSLEPEAEALLRDQAAHEGQAAEAVAAALLTGVLAEEARTRAETVQAVRRGLADGAAGRIIGLADWDAKMRTKHGIRADVAPLSAEELDALP